MADHRRRAGAPAGHTARASWLVALALLLLPALAPAELPSDLPLDPSEEDRWVLVDTERHKVAVFDGDHRLAVFDNPAVGRGGTSEHRRRGDRTTPLGAFEVDHVNHDSHYHLFLSLDYPSVTDARQALEAGVIDEAEYEHYLDEYRRLGRRPQRTALGGHIGIHGTGDRNVAFHRRVHWTDGCVALEDAQMDALAELVEVGTPVVIR